MSSFNTFEISASGMTAHRLWLDVIAGNLANAQSTRTLAGGPFHRKYVVLAQGEESQVVVDSIREDTYSPLRLIHDPHHPDADAAGYVRYPNVNPVREMVDLLSATRLYEANSVVLGATRGMMQRALDIGRG